MRKSWQANIDFRIPASGEFRLQFSDGAGAFDSLSLTRAAANVVSFGLGTQAGTFRFAMPTTGSPVTALAVTAPGSKYNPATTTAEIAGGGGTDATASLTIPTGAITAVDLDVGGTGYTAETCTVEAQGGGGEGAVLTPVIADGVITGITVTDGGSGYYDVPTIVITDSGVGADGAAHAHITEGAGTVTGITLTAPGSGYISAPTVTITDSGDGEGATATADISEVDCYFQIMDQAGAPMLQLADKRTDPAGRTVVLGWGAGDAGLTGLSFLMQDDAEISFGFELASTWTLKFDGLYLGATKILGGTPVPTIYCANVALDASGIAALPTAIPDGYRVVVSYHDATGTILPWSTWNSDHWELHGDPMASVDFVAAPYNYPV